MPRLSRAGIVRRVAGLRRFVSPMVRATDMQARMAALPFADIRAIAGAGPILVLAPHPDDESLGCGGLIAQACAAGIAVHVAVLTDGSGSHPGSSLYPPARLVKLREAETAEAVDVLGVPSGHLHFLRYRDTAAPRSGAALASAAARLAGLARDHGIATVFATWQHDPHCDHLAAHRIALLAAKQAPFRLLSYAVWGWTLPATQWLPRQPVSGWRLDVAAELSTKRQAIACHRSQMPGLISDDPAGFQLPHWLLELCDRPFEVFLQQPSRR